MLKHTNKKLKIILVYSLGLLFLGSCAKQNPVVGLMLPHMHIQRYHIEKDEFTSRISALGGKVEFKSANNDEQLQLAQLDSLLNEGIDVLVLDPVNRFTAAQMVRKAHAKGVKVISYDRLISNCDVDAFLSFDAKMVGRQMAESLMKLKPAGNYILLEGDKTDINAIGIDQGQQEILGPAIKSGSIHVMYKMFIEQWSQDEAALDVQHCIDLLSGQVPDVILAGSDDLAQGAIKTLQKDGLAGKVLVSGHNGDLSACKNIIKGFQLMTVYKPYKKLANTAAELAFKILNHKKVSDILETTMNNGKLNIPTRLLPTIPVTAANMQSTIIADGIFTQQDLAK